MSNSVKPRHSHNRLPQRGRPEASQWEEEGEGASNSKEGEKYKSLYVDEGESFHAQRGGGVPHSLKC